MKGTVSDPDGFDLEDDLEVGSGVRRVNNVPLYIVIAVSVVFVLTMMLVMVHRSQNQLRQEKDEQQKPSESTDLASQIVGPHRTGFIPSATPPLAMPEKLPPPSSPSHIRLLIIHYRSELMKCLEKIVFLMTFIMTAPAQAIFGMGDIVYDPSNFAQNITAAISEVTQELKQVEQYTTQLRELMTAKQQLDDMVQNTKQLTRFSWDDAQGTITQLLGITNTIDDFKNQLGSFDNFLGQFHVIDYYRNLPCIGANSCTVADLAKLAEVDRLSSEARKKANDALFRGVDQQQQTLQKDSAHLRQLQQAAQSSTGRLQALQAANELASEQANQLLQIRGLLVAQQNALATQMAVQNDKEARAIALEEKFKSGKYNLSKGKTW